MKRILSFFTILLITMTVMACQTENTNIPDYLTEELTPQNPTVEDGYLVELPQKGTILHAWNWSMSTIESHLEDIAIAGFSTVQISPMQPQKDYFGIASWGSTWWKLYQPLGFSIATENHSLGTKEELISLTEAADAYGIKIIVDVVANHLAGGYENSLNEDVAGYEPEIYNQNLIHTDNGAVSDSSIEAVTKGYLGEYPDLQTESNIVQERVLSLLKEYVDAGVSGFRFDAAKHIETQNDGEYASDFWLEIIDGVKLYANNQGINDLYIYGEILNTPGRNRSYTDYTEYMSITMNEMSDNIRTAVLTRDADRLTDLSYINNVPGDKTVLWAESHDDFAGGSTDDLSYSHMIKAYAIQASRKEATTLFFVRPNDETFMGEIGSYEWQSLEVSSVNRFHNFFVDGDETLSIQDGFFLNERYNEESYGVVIVDVEGNGSVTNLNVSHLPDGDYRDQVTNNNFVVKDGKITGEVGESGVAVVHNNPYEPKPVVYVSNDGLHGTFSDVLPITIYSYNTTEAYYSINDGEKVSLNGNVDIELTYPEENGTVTLDIEVWYEDYKVEKHYEYLKNNLVVEDVTINNLNTIIVEAKKIVAWTWEQGEDGEWVEGTYDDGTFIFDLPEGNNYFLLVTFPEGTTSFDWENKLMQTGDTEVPNDGIYDGSQLTWN
ncbi:MAG: alpha-amylase family glycosyl hydrolase [Tenericutes bacterium]|jgi:alpha-amylase|nr:alpha-amylase family glycosyl hydrolase [Mycoplasmatota bacterium]